MTLTALYIVYGAKLISGDRTVQFWSHQKSSLDVTNAPYHDVDGLQYVKTLLIFLHFIIYVTH